MTTTIRISPSLRTECGEVLKEMGLTLSGAITLFLKQVALTRSIPFEIKAHTPNIETRRVLDRYLAGEEKMSKEFSSTDELMKDLLDA